MDFKYDNIKITLIGNSGIGKTCIINRYVKDTFTEGTQSTIGADYAQKKLDIDNKQIIVNIWDTSGQEKYRALGRHFYQDSYIVFLVYDITEKQSFEAIKEVWLPNLKKFGEEYATLALVGNKCDKLEEEKVSEEEARNYAKEIGATYMLTSAKTGQGVDDLFSTLINQYLSSDNYKNLEKNNGKGGEFIVRKATKEEEEEFQKKKKKRCC